jgi:anaerobic selenocysteine-containing dehydrogenase
LTILMENGTSYVEHAKPWRYQEDGLTVTRTSAWSGPGCHIGCSVLLYTDDNDRLVRVEGDPESPFNGGRLCVRCLSLPEVTNSPLRLTKPMRRSRADRGKDAWQAIGWDEAFDLIVGQFNAAKTEYGAESVIFAQGTGRDSSHYLTRLCYSFGSPNYTSLFSGNACYIPRVAGLIATTGSFWIADVSSQFVDRYDNPEYVVPEVMFIWGNYPLRSNSDGLYGHTIIDLMRRGMKIVMIDPKVTWLSAKAELHLRVRPGTDAALALGMLNVLVNEKLYVSDFVDRWCYGFEELCERVQEYPPERVAAITWVPVEQIIAAARLLGQAKPACLQWGVAVDMTREAMPACQAMIGLFQITGNIDVPGGMITPPEIMSYGGGWGTSLKGGDILSQEQADKRIGLEKYALLRMGFSLSHPDSVYEAIKTGKPYPIKAAYFHQNNFLACMAAQPQEVARELAEKLDFAACTDLFMTPTIMACADVVLPAATFPERDGLRLGDGGQRGETINKVTQIGDCKSDMEICLELGKRFCPEEWPWPDALEMFDYMISDSLGMGFVEVRDKAPVYLPYQYRKYEKGLMRPDGQPGFRTQTGRLELYSLFFSDAELNPLPYFEEPSPGPEATPALMAAYPFVLTTGARNWGYFHSEHRNIPRLRAMHPNPTIQMHPDALVDLGIADGEWVKVENHLGHCKARVQATPVVRKEIIHIDHGWWLPEADPEALFDIFAVSVNNLIEWGCGSSGFGANYKCTVCKVSRLDQSKEEVLC